MNKEQATRYFNEQYPALAIMDQLFGTNLRVEQAYADGWAHYTDGKWYRR